MAEETREQRSLRIINSEQERLEGFMREEDAIRTNIARVTRDIFLNNHEEIIGKKVVFRQASGKWE